MYAQLGESAALGRRSFLRGILLGLAGVSIDALISGCTESFSSRGAGDEGVYIHAPTSVLPSARRPTAAPTMPTAASSQSGSASTVLLAYFSRAGENYFYGGRTQLKVGNTEVLVHMISQLIGCDVYRIEPADPYSDNYAETVARNVREQNADARPAIANPLASIARYDIVLLGSPIWNVRAPMIMSTFAERFDFSGKTVFPFTTYAVGGLGTTMRDYAAACHGATIGEGLAVRGEEVRAAGPAVEAWLRRSKLLMS